MQDPTRGDGYVEEAHGVAVLVAGDQNILAWRQIERESLVLADVLARVKKMPAELKATKPPPTGSGSGATDTQRLANQARNQLGGRDAAIEWLKENSSGATTSEKKINLAAIEILKKQPGDAKPSAPKKGPTPDEIYDASRETFRAASQKFTQERKD